MHKPVLLQEVVSVLDLHPGDFVIDGTLGSGGHAKELIQRVAPSGMFLGTDRDPRAIEAFAARKSEFAHQLKYLHVFATSYADVAQILARESLPQADALLVDLGFSSEQIDGSFIGRGFSFMRDEPLVMTYDASSTPVSTLLATLSLEQLTDIIREFGEERYAHKVAQGIIDFRSKQEIKTSGQLTTLIKAVLPKSYERGRIHPATRTFQALRIYANRELDQLKELLSSLKTVVKPGGRVAVITFHSLEDRIVKHYFKDGRFPDEPFPNQIPGEELEGVYRSAQSKVELFSLITKKPMTASSTEIELNPRARSAKLRAAIVL